MTSETKRIIAEFPLKADTNLEVALKEAHRVRSNLNLDVIMLQYGYATIHVGVKTAVCHNWPHCTGTREWKLKEIITHEWVET